MKLMICADLDVGGSPAIDLASSKIAKLQEDRIESSVVMLEESAICARANWAERRELKGKAKNDFK